MTVAHEVSALIASFADRSRAERFVKELKRAGFKDEEIGILSPHDHKDEVEEDTVTGALTGGALGAVAGAVATGVIPGLGPVIAAGILSGVLGGAAAGAAAGGILGALISLGVPEDKAHSYEEEFLAGRTLVVVQAVARGGQAMEILQRCNHSEER
jgi:outer membrane lipoprotein SlyB